MTLALGLRFFILPIDCSTAFDASDHDTFYLSRVWGQILLILISIGSAFWFRRIINDSGITSFNERVSLYPIAFYTLTAGLSCHSLSLAVLSILMMTLFALVIGLREGDSLSSAAFRAGLIISVMGMFSPLFFILVLFVLPALSFVRSLDWRSISWTCLGLATPFYLLLSIHYLITGDMGIDLIRSPILESTTYVRPEGGAVTVAYILVMVALIVLLTIRTLQASRKGVVRRRKILRTGVLLMIISLILSLALYRLSGVQSFLSLMAIPLSILSLELLKDDSHWSDVILFILWVITTVLFLWN